MNYQVMRQFDNLRYFSLNKLQNEWVLLVAFLLLALSTNGQNSQGGFWDTHHAVVTEIQLAAGKRIWRRVELPPGTKEVGVRITLLNDNQELASSFADLLGAIPTTTSQIASASVNFTSRVFGDDKCIYSVYTNQADANRYCNTGSYLNARYYNNSPITKEVIFLRSDRIGSNPNQLYFAFKSQNLLLNERIMLEVVPWVDNVASRGWTKEIKEAVLEGCIKGAKELENPAVVCQCMLGKLQERYTTESIQELTESESNTISREMVTECLKETGEDQNIADKMRSKAIRAAQKGNYAEAISNYQEILSSTTPTAIDYNNLGYYYILSRQFSKAIKYLKIGEALDESELYIKGNLAHAYLLNGDIDLAKALYLRYKAQNISETVSWLQMVKNDFANFRKIGLPSDSFSMIEQLLQ